MTAASDGGSGSGGPGARADQAARGRPDDPPAYYQCHVFCCVNKREAGHPRGCCSDKGSVALRDYMKEAARKLRLPRVRINASQCLDRCELGPTMVIYPEGVWYSYASRADVDEILQSHLVEGRRVERLLLRPGDVKPPR